MNNLVWFSRRQLRYGLIVASRGNGRRNLLWGRGKKWFQRSGAMHRHRRNVIFVYYYYYVTRTGNYAVPAKVCSAGQNIKHHKQE